MTDRSNFLWKILAWYEEGSEVPPSNLGTTSNSGLQVPPFQPLNVSVQKV